jgi:hypothetical protein
MSIINEMKAERTRIPPKVKGPIRCHKCQLLCRDAEHYLSHKCDSNRSRDNSSRTSSHNGIVRGTIPVSLN